MSDKHHVVIIGGGFGGLYAAQKLKRAPVDVTLIDRHNFHLFQPLLYQVATGTLCPANIASPLRSIMKRHTNTKTLLAEACDFDLDRRRVLLTDGEIAYDSLIIAAGVTNNYFGNDHWEPLAPGLKSIEDASEMRRRILSAFEAAEREPDPNQVPAWLTFIVVGGGPTGVELAGALAELARITFRRNFRAINPQDTKIILVEGYKRILPSFPEQLAAKAQASLERLGVTVRCGLNVTKIQPDCVMLGAGDQRENIPARTVLWGAGVAASPLGKKLANAAGIETDRGFVPVQPDLTMAGHAEVFVIGDLAHCPDGRGGTLPGVAQVAMQQGHYVAQLIRRRQNGKTLPPFRYHDRGSMVTIGRMRAVADLGKLKLSGPLAWLLWLFIHLMYITTFQNRLLIVIQWAVSYLSWNRADRLITGKSPLPLWNAVEGEKTLETQSARKDEDTAKT